MLNRCFLAIAFLLLTTNLAHSQSELITNGGFEKASGPQSASPWTFASNTPGFFVGIGFPNPHLGNNYVYFGADISGTKINSANGVITQMVSIPNGTTSATLTFWLSISTDETTTTQGYDVMDVIFGSTLVKAYSNLDKTAYAEQSFTLNNISSYQGQNVALSFSGITDASNPTVFRIDDVSIQATVATNGTLAVNTTPVSGDIYVDNIYKGNGNWTGLLSVGSHTVSFGAVQGYSTPASQPVNVVANQTTTVTGWSSPRKVDKELSHS